MLIAHMSDLHIRPKNQLYQGLVDSNTMAEAAIRQINCLVPQPDLVILSGDIVDEGSPAEYAVAREILGQLTAPLLVIPGNHDDREVLRQNFADHAYLPKTGPLHFSAGDYGPLRIIGLDISVPGQHHGDIDDDTVNWLEKTLAEEPERPTLIMMHQYPFKSGIPYIDDYICERGERLADIVQKFPAIERVVCGHIHRFMQLRFGGTLLCTAPSTTTAIALRLSPDAEPASYVEPPACLLHHWKPDTGLITHFVPIGNFPGPLPFF
jgi:3',5'-cyclic AMP phosphodiesterase CpdA